MQPKPQPNIKCHTCGNDIYRPPCKLGKFVRVFCDVECLMAEKITWIPYLLANMRKLRSRDMAAYIGIRQATLRTWVWHINKDLPAGIKISFDRSLAQTGRPTTRPPRPKKAPCTPVAKMPATVSQKPVKPQKAVLNTQTQRRVIKQEKQVKLKTPVFDPELHMMVRLNGKTWKQVLRTDKKKHNGKANTSRRGYHRKGNETAAGKAQPRACRNVLPLRS